MVSGCTLAGAQRGGELPPFWAPGPAPRGRPPCPFETLATTIATRSTPPPPRISARLRPFIYGYPLIPLITPRSNRLFQRRLGDVGVRERFHVALLRLGEIHLGVQ